MKKKGLVASRPIVRKRDGKKTAACYYITSKGINFLLEKKIIPKGRRADRNMVKGNEINDVLDINELHVHLHNKGYQLVERRAWNVEYGLNYNSLTSGGLITKDGKRYSVYMIAGNAEQETIARIKNEIIEQPQSSRFMIFFKGPNSFKYYRTHIKDGELGYIEYCLLPYNFIAFRLPFFPEQSYFVKLFTKFGKVEENRTKTSNTSFADYLLRIENGQEYYVCNFLLLDYAALARVSSYPMQQYKNDGRKIAIFCWKELRHLLTSIESYEFVEIFEVTEEHIQDHEDYEEVMNRLLNAEFRNPMAED